MSNEFTCAACGQSMTADVVAGSEVRCPYCNEVVAAPAYAAKTPPTSPASHIRPVALQQGMAVAALILGIIGLVSCPILGILGLIFGIIALSRIRREPSRFGGHGMAVGGIVTGAISIVFTTAMMLLLLVPMLALPASLTRARELAKRLVCAANMKGIATSMNIYHDDFGVPPSNFSVLVDTGGIGPQQFVCPSSDAQPGDYDACYVLVAPSAVPSESGGSEVSPMNVVMYEADNHDAEGGNVLFSDGHTEFIKPYSRVLELVAETNQRLQSGGN